MAIDHFKVGRTIDRTSYEVVGVTYGGSNFWHSHVISSFPPPYDPNECDIYECDIDGNTLSFFSVPPNPPTDQICGGLAWDGTNLWLSNGWTLNQVQQGEGIIQEFSTVGVELSRFAMPGEQVTGLVWDGTYLWCVDPTNDTIFKVTTDGTIIDSFAFPGTPTTYPIGIAWDGTYLWCCGNLAGPDPLYQIDTSGTVLEQWFIPEEVVSPTGLVFRNGTLWCACANTDKIYELIPVSPGDKIAMTVDPTGVPWYAWLDGNDLKINRFASETPTSATAIEVDTSGDFDSVAGVVFTGGILRVIVRKESDEKPYCFTSTDFGASWSSAVLIE